MSYRLFLNSNIEEEYLAVNLFNIDNLFIRFYKETFEGKKQFTFQRKCVLITKESADLYSEKEISPADFENFYYTKKDEDNVLTFLNYEDFENQFSLNDLKEYLTNEFSFLNSCYEIEANEFILEPDLSRLKSEFNLNQVILCINRTINNLKGLLHVEFLQQPNHIQIFIINFLIEEYGSTLSLLKVKYSKSFPNLFEDVSVHNINNHPDFFKEEVHYSSFIKYAKLIKDDNQYKFFGYVFQRMLSENKIHKISHMEFASYLKDNNFISDKVFDDICVKNQFDSLTKSKSKLREILYTEAFDN